MGDDKDPRVVMSTDTVPALPALIVDGMDEELDPPPPPAAAALLMAVVVLQLYATKR